MSAESAWTAYWRDELSAGCLTGAPEPVRLALADEWARFAALLPEGARVLDLATGSGAVLDAMLEARPDLVAAGVDSAALPERGNPRLIGGIDAAALPFDGDAFDAVTSQFGLEYCPAGAISEGLRVLVPGGRFHFVVHAADSSVVLHNRDRLAALEGLIGAGLLDAARRAAAGLPPPAGAAERVEAVRRANPGQSLINELPLALTQALRTPTPLPAVNRIAAKATAEIERLRAMAAAAKDAGGLEEMAAALRSRGADVTVGELSSDPYRIAWTLSGRKR